MIAWPTSFSPLACHPSDHHSAQRPAQNQLAYQLAYSPLKFSGWFGQESVVVLCCGCSLCKALPALADIDIVVHEMPTVEALQQLQPSGYSIPGNPAYEDQIDGLCKHRTTNIR